mmetsp:Transcript_38391/g.52106  ORF Transcript_38391/g.52106 Transcript_38391/m.52106 type:complete len:90 (-) Transcript_38391:94-363(-)
MKVPRPLWFDYDFGNIIYTDYTNYLVIYKCVQQWMDFYTNEYVEVYSRTTSLTDDQKTDIATFLNANLEKNFDSASLSDSAVNPSDCLE